MTSRQSYNFTNGKLTVQIEDLLPHANWGGWIYQPLGVGNLGAQGAHYYYKSQTEDGSHGTVPQNGHFSFSFDTAESGYYSILLRSTRDTNTPGDSRNDIWIRVDEDTQSVMPAGSPELTAGGQGFVKFKGAQTVWGNSHMFSTEQHGDQNPASTVVLDKGLHTITFAPRSTGFHIDSVQVVKVAPPATEPVVTPEIKVWLGQDGYRDSDDNLAMLIGSAQALTAAQANGALSIGGVIFGDTKDGGQYYMLNPTGKAPAAFGQDSRYGDVAGNKQAAGNYAFFKQYGTKALSDLDPDWAKIDLLAQDDGGKRTWNFDAGSKSQISSAAQALADDIKAAIAKTGGAHHAAELVVYSAGGGANVAGEALGYLYNQGYSHAAIIKHFAVIQHGNWLKNYEPEARELTRDVTIAISDQNMARYRNGMDGPDLKHAVTAAGLNGSKFGADFAKALAVAIGEKAFAGPLLGATFSPTKDASDAGSHAFALDTEALLSAWSHRLNGGEIRTDDNWGHLIDDGASNRLRVIYSAFDAEDIVRLMKGGKLPSEPLPTGSTAHSVTASIAHSASDYETVGGISSDDLEFGAKNTALGAKSNDIGLLFGGLDLDPIAEISDAYFVFVAEEGTTSKGTLKIEIENSETAKSFAKVGLSNRDWLDEGVAWTVGVWKQGETYRTPDLSSLIERVVHGELVAHDTLAFRVSGTGTHSAYSFDSAGAEPKLVVEYHLIA